MAMIEECPKFSVHTEAPFPTSVGKEKGDRYLRRPHLSKFTDAESWLVPHGGGSSCRQRKDSHHAPGTPDAA